MDSTIPNLNKKDLQSQALDLLRFPLAIMVVIEHVIPNFAELKPDEIQFDLDSMPLFGSLCNLLSIFIRAHGVPIFFFISGYLFFLGSEFSKEIYVRKLKSRVKTLLIPYLIWNTFSLASLFVSRMPVLAAYVKNPTLTPNIHGFLSAYFAYDGSLVAHVAEQTDGYPAPILSPLWFVRNLMIAVLLAPILYHLIKRLKLTLLVLLGLPWFFLVYKFNIYAGLPTTLFFFSWGAYMSIHKKGFADVFSRHFKSTTALFICSGALGVASFYILPEATHYLRQTNILFSVVFACNISTWLLQRGRCHVNRFLASSSFFLYVSHPIVLSYVGKLFMIILKPASDLGVIAVYTLIFAITVTILLMTYRLLQKRCPTLLGVLTGRK